MKWFFYISDETKNRYPIYIIIIIIIIKYFIFSSLLTPGSSHLIFLCKRSSGMFFYIPIKVIISIIYCILLIVFRFINGFN